MAVLVPSRCGKQPPWKDSTGSFTVGHDKAFLKFQVIGLQSASTSNVDNTDGSHRASLGALITRNPQLPCSLLHEPARRLVALERHHQSRFHCCTRVEGNRKGGVAVPFPSVSKSADVTVDHQPSSSKSINNHDNLTYIRLGLCRCWLAKRGRVGGCRTICPACVVIRE